MRLGVSSFSNYDKNVFDIEPFTRLAFWILCWNLINDNYDIWLTLISCAHGMSSLFPFSLTEKNLVDFYTTNEIYKIFELTQKCENISTTRLNKQQN